MKYTKKVFLLCILTLVMAACCALGGCGGSTVKLTFETGLGPAVESMSVEKGSEQTLPQPSAYEGYSFGGWYLSADCSGSPVLTYRAEKNATFYAKWEKLYLVTLDLGGGTLSSSSLYLREGENILSALEGSVPQKAGFSFGEWLYGESPLSANERMPAENISLTAHYKVGYTVEIYEQTPDLSGYEKGESVTGFAYADGTVFTPSVERAGFVRAEHDGTVSSLVLNGSDPSANLFKLWFDRAEAEIFFESNYPDGRENIRVTVNALCGTEIELPIDSFRINGYMLIGWSLNPADSEHYYPTNALETALSNAEKGEAGKYTVSESVALYAVWLKGYSDLFGGADSVYLVGEKVYVSRAGYLFLGETVETDTGDPLYAGEIRFSVRSGGRSVLRGALYPNGTYCYFDQSRNGFTATFYDTSRDRLDQTVTIMLDGYNGITYIKREGEGQTTSRGTYSVENGYFVASFQSGSLAGQTMTMTFGSYTDGEGYTRSAFRVRNNEQAGIYLRFYAENGRLASYSEEEYYIYLDGFGSAVYFDGSSEQELYYTADGDFVSLYDGSGNSYGSFFVTERGGERGFLAYDESLDTTFFGPSTSTLVLDGTVNATYTDESGTAHKGLYGAYSSALGGVLIEFWEGGESRLFLAGASAAGDGAAYYSFEPKVSTYQEYYYSGVGGAENVYSSPLIALDDSGENTFTVYGDVNGLYYYVVAQGTYVYDEETDRYTAAISSYGTAEVDEMPVDVKNLSAFTFSVLLGAAEDGTIPVAYWWSYVGKDGQSTNCDATYSEENGSGTLTFVGGVAVYRSEEGTLGGLYTADGNILILSAFEYDPVYGELYLVRLFFLVDQDAETFTVMESLLRGTMYALLPNGNISENVVLTLDGIGGARYSTLTETDGGYDEDYVMGTYAPTEERTQMGDVIYSFTSEDGSEDFRFIIIQLNSSVVLFARERAEYSGVYSAAGVGDVYVDGFCWYASYLDAMGAEHAGLYYFYDEEKGIIALLSVSDGDAYHTYYFDLINGGNGEKTLRRRGAELGNYVIVDNQNMTGRCVELDGLGHAVVYLPSGDGTSRTVIDGNAVYEIGDLGYVITYTDGAETHILTGAIDTLVLSSEDAFNAFVCFHEEITAVYLNGNDFSVLVLDGFGYAVRYTAMGVAEQGLYVILSDSLFYYVNGDESDSALYRYNRAEGTAAPVELTNVAYYTSSLEALYFTEYGFAMFNGETAYYYDVVDGAVVLYRNLPSDPSANRYGFVENRDFGSFAETVLFDGVTYYRTDGFGLTFTRSADNASRYPIGENGSGEPVYLEDITFTPTGGTQFAATGAIRVTGEDLPYTCTVVRGEENGVPCTYLEVDLATGIYYRFDFEIEYHGGSTGTYRFTSMKYIEEMVAYKYLYVFYMLYTMYGPTTAATVTNDYGVISLITEYDEAGQAQSRVLSGDFFEDSGLFDLNGKLVASVESEYEEETVAGTDGAGNAVDLTYYTVEFERDGIVYRLHLQRQYLSAMGTYGYIIYAFTKLDVLRDGEYYVDLETVLSTEMTNVQVGDVTVPYLYTKDGEERTDILFHYSYLIGNTFYGVINTYDQDELHIERSEVYVIDLTKTENVYTGVRVTYRLAKTVEYVDPVSAQVGYFQYFEEDHRVTMFTYGGYLFPASESTYDASGGVYLVTAPTGRKYRITEKDGSAEIEEYSEDVSESSQA